MERVAVARAAADIAYESDVEEGYKGNKKISVSSNGKVTVKKGLKPGTYNVKVKVTAAGNGTYNKATRTVTCTVVVE